MDNSKQIHLNLKKVVPPLTLKKDIFTATKHSMDYFTVAGVILRTGYKNKRDWYLLPIREMLDNDADFLWKNYKGSDNATITVNVTMDDNLFRLIVRNSNPNNIPVFPDLESTFDYEMRYGTKQDVHIITRGMLGDAMKQILSLGYVLLHANDDGTGFKDKQWEHPLIIRHNKIERKIYLKVDKAAQRGEVDIETSPEAVSHTDTEIELVLPVIDEVRVRNSLDRSCIEQFCRKYSILTTDISFKFRIIDDITHTEPEEEDSEFDPNLFDSESDPGQELSKVLSTVPEKGILNIDIPAIHPISSNWNNSDFIHSYKPDEFTRRIINVHDKESILVYEVLKEFREGSNIPKTAENQMTIAQLLKKSNKDKIIEKQFNQLTKVLNAPAELSLPYTTNSKNSKKRYDVLVERIGKLYNIDTSEKAKSSYKLVRDTHRDDNIQTLEYPFAFEIIAIPLKEPYGPDDSWDKPKPHEFIGAVNYSVSPKNNIFEGDYGIVKGYYSNTTDINKLLRSYGFHEYGASYNRVPCVIVGNLITPRRDPQSHDKSSIDTKPFVNVIKDAIEKISKEIQTFRAAGYSFYGRDNKDVSKHDINRKVNAKNLLEQFLIRERGLPGHRNNLLAQEEDE